MTESNVLERAFKSPGKKSLIDILPAIITLIVVANICSRSTALLPGGHIVEEPGLYTFQPGHRVLKISKDESGNIAMLLTKRGEPYFSYTFESERDWFATIDQYQRLWVFTGHWEKEWGPKRKLPSGGTKPSTPAVILHGGIIFRPGVLAIGSSVVTDTGYWEGVPEKFFDQIPSQDGAEWGNVPPIPPSAPRFTEKEELALMDRIARRSW